MNITVIGAGYVGLTLAAVLADFGHQVWVVRKDKEKNEALKKGKVHFFEPGLDELVRKNLKAKRLLPTTDYEEAVPFSDVVFIAVGTPSLPSGEADLSQVFSAAREVGKSLKKGYTVVVNKSTVPPGTTKKVFSLVSRSKKSGAHFEIAFCPEFLREGTALKDTLCPDRVVIGSESEKATKILKELHRPFKAPILVTKIESAELIKYSANSYLALRIVFANQIADVCEKTGADIEEVIRGIGLDKRIGGHYWYPGLGYGGSCFPKDVAGLAFFAKEKGMKGNLFEKMDTLNKERIAKTLAQLKNQFGSLAGKKVAVWGLACKQGTDDVRHSPAMVITEALLEKKAKVQAYDPKAEENARRILSKLVLSPDPYQVVKDAEALLILTDWPQFQKLDFKKVKRLMKGKFLFDSRNILPKEKIVSLGFRYLGVGR